MRTILNKTIAHTHEPRRIHMSVVSAGHDMVLSCPSSPSAHVCPPARYPPVFGKISDPGLTAIGGHGYSTDACTANMLPQLRRQLFSSRPMQRVRIKPNARAFGHIHSDLRKQATIPLG